MQKSAGKVLASIFGTKTASSSLSSKGPKYQRGVLLVSVGAIKGHFEGKTPREDHQGDYISSFVTNNGNLKRLHIHYKMWPNQPCCQWEDGTNRQEDEVRILKLRVFVYRSFATTVSQRKICDFFLEKRLKVLKCYTFLWVQRWHNCSPAATFADCVMTPYLLKVHLQTFLSIPITQKFPNFELWHSCRKWAVWSFFYRCTMDRSCITEKPCINQGFTWQLQCSHSDKINAICKTCSVGKALLFAECKTWWVYLSIL